MAQKSVNQSLKSINLTIEFDINKPDRNSRSGVPIWDVEAESADGFRIYVQVYGPAKKRPEKTTATRVTVK